MIAWTNGWKVKNTILEDAFVDFDSDFDFFSEDDLACDVKSYQPIKRIADKEIIKKIRKMSIEELSKPTNFPVGSQERVEIYAARYKHGLPIFVAGDNSTFCEYN